MKPLRHRALFGFAVAAGIALVLAPPAYQRWTRPPAAVVKPLSARIAVTEQLALAQIPELGERFRTIIDLRPDGEAAGQPAAEQVRAEARRNGMRFAYVPVPHGAIPDSAVTALDEAIAASRGPLLLYCRSGRRAARTWGLVEASRAGGADAGAILAAVKASGQTADDLAPEIARRIALRGQVVKAAP